MIKATRLIKKTKKRRLYDHKFTISSSGCSNRRKLNKSSEVAWLSRRAGVKVAKRVWFSDAKITTN